MADNSMSSIGTGIGLQGRVSTRGFESLIARRQALDAAGKRAKGKENLQKYTDAIKIDADKVHRLDYQNYVDSNAKFVKTVDENLQQYGDAWLNTPQAMELQSQQKIYNEQFGVRKQSLDKQTAELMSLQKEGKALHPEQQDFLKAVGTGNYDDIDEIGKKYGQYGNVVTGRDKYGRSEVAITSRPKTDIGVIAEKFNKHPQPETDVSKWDKIVTGKIGDKQIGYDVIPWNASEGDVKQASNQILTDEGALGDYQRYYRPAIEDKYKNKNFDNKDDELLRTAGQRDEVENVFKSIMASKQMSPNKTTWTPPRPRESEKQTTGAGSFSQGDMFWKLTTNPQTPVDASTYNYKAGAGGTPTKEEVEKQTSKGHVTISPLGVTTKANDGAITTIHPQTSDERTVDFHRGKTANDNPVISLNTDNAIDANTGQRVAIRDRGLKNYKWQERTINGKKGWYLEVRPESEVTLTEGDATNKKTHKEYSKGDYLIPERDVRGAVGTKYGNIDLKTALLKMGEDVSTLDDSGDKGLRAGDKQKGVKGTTSEASPIEKKSKSGKDIISTDGGKTWQYK